MARRYNNGISIWFLSVVLMEAAILGACGWSPSNSSDTDQAAPHFYKLPIPYKIGSTVPEEFRDDVRAGFEEWNIAMGSEVFVYSGIKDLGPDQLAPDYTPNENVVLATARSGADILGEAPAASGEGPLARTWLRGVTAIRDADIYLFEFNLNYVSGRPNTGDVYSIQSVVMHEAGHILFGDAHSEDPESIMTAQLYPIGHPLEKLGLSESDIQKFTEVYGQL